MRKKLFILMFIVVVAAFLRFWQLGQNPPSLTWDEAAWGYNAYSLGVDGKDEFGRFLPLDYIESFGDFKPPLYAYLSILPVKLFGLTEFSTRFASAFFGTLTVLLTYFLTKQLFFKVGASSSLVARKLPASPIGERVEHSATRESKSPPFSLNFIDHKFGIPLIATAIMAISPWHMLLSRAAFEANVATFFLVLGVYLFLLSTNQRKWLFSLSILSFILSMYTFNTARIVAPLLIFGLMIGKRNELLKMKKQVFFAFILGLIIFLPLGRFLLTPQAQLRFHEVNIFSDLSIIQRQNIQIVNDNETMFSKIIHNRRFAYAVEYLRHYFDHFNPWFLFKRGDGNPKFSIQDVGQLYMWEIPFFIAGILFLFRRREGLPAGRQGDWWIIPYWLIIGIVPAATARETPHALRIEATLPTFQILTAYGVYHLISNIKSSAFAKVFDPEASLRGDLVEPDRRASADKQKSNLYLKSLIFIVFIFIIAFNFIYFLHNYFVHYPREFSGEWQYGYREAIAYVKKVEDQYDTIYFTEDFGRPYIYFLFYLQYDPEKFRQEALVEREVFGFVHVKRFGKYRFDRELHGRKTIGKNILFVNTVSKVPGKVYTKKIFHLLDGKKGLVAYTL